LNRTVVRVCGGSEGTGAHGWAGAQGATGGAGWLKKMITPATRARPRSRPTNTTTMRPEPIFVGAGDGAQPGRP